MKSLDLDFIALDGEMLPWTLKATHLIYDSFLIPGECSLVAREYIYGKDSPEYKNAENYLSTLNHYTAQSKPEFRVFQVLAVGKIDQKTKQIRVTTMGAHLPALEKYNFMKKFETKHVKCVEHISVNLNSEVERKNAVAEWEKYCKEGGEGWVIKISPQFQDTPTGHLMLPMVKVRGVDYLRLIYGIDYLEPNYFNFIKKRDIAPKRVLSRLQFEIADNILKCYLQGLTHLQMKYVAAYYGTDSGNINATL